MNALSDADWKRFEVQGYLHLGACLDANDLAGLQARIDAIMLGDADVDYARMMMQLDSATGEYGDAGAQSKGHKGATLDYRKIESLEYDPLFLAYLQRPLFADICRRSYGEDTDVRCLRAMFMNKPAGRGTVLPWHQDRWTALDRDPQITIWTALDPATRENGCVQIVPGTHKELVNKEHPSGFLSKEQAAERVSDDDVVHLELQAGEVVLLHNWLLHASDVNRSEQSRRAFSVCYMDGATRTHDGQPVDFPVIFGDGALT